MPYNPYNFPHKLCRSMLFQTAAAAGKADYADPVERLEIISQVEEILEFLDEHARHEALVFHPLFQGALPEWVAELEKSHDRLDQTAAKVKGVLAELRASPSEPLAAGARLYGAFNELVGQQLLHLAEEESALLRIWQAIPEPELLKIPAAVQKLVTPEQSQKTLRSMLPVLTPAERAGLFKVFRSAIPEERYRGLVGLAQELLPPPTWEKLRVALGDAA
jgi:hypothetical protein